MAPRTLRVGAVQLTGGADVARNVATAERLVRDAAGRGAQLIVLPEKWPILEVGEAPEQAAQTLTGPWLAAASAWAADLGVWLVAGSILEADGASVHNTTALIGPEGRLVATYRKIHMFDVVVGGRQYHESAATTAGSEVVAVDAAGVRLGLAICYDLRFPELFRALADRGMEVLALPAAFTAATGRDHWEVLLRARAIENQCFVVAADQVGTHANGSASFGRSMIVDPWGTVLAQAPDEECAIVADCDLSRMERLRQSLPALAHRRPIRR